MLEARRIYVRGVERRNDLDWNDDVRHWKITTDVGEQFYTRSQNIVGKKDTGEEIIVVIRKQNREIDHPFITFAGKGEHYKVKPPNRKDIDKGYIRKSGQREQGNRINVERTMSLIAKNTDGDKKERDPIPQGPHIAICYGVIDLGTHESEYQGREYDSRKVMLQWELPGQRIEYEKDGKKMEGPRVISKEYTLSLGEKANLRKDLQGWRGRAFTEEELNGFDLRNVLGKPCQILITHKTSQRGKTYARVDAVIALSGQATPTQHNDNLWFSLEETKEIPENLYDWMKTKIKESKEMRDVGASEQVMDAMSQQQEEDPIPF